MRFLPLILWWSALIPIVLVAVLRWRWPYRAYFVLGSLWSLISVLLFQ